MCTSDFPRPLTGCRKLIPHHHAVLLGLTKDHQNETYPAKVTRGLPRTLLLSSRSDGSGHDGLTAPDYPPRLARPAMPFIPLALAVSPLFYRRLCSRSLISHSWSNPSTSQLPSDAHLNGDIANRHESPYVAAITDQAVYLTALLNRYKARRPLLGKSSPTMTFGRESLGSTRDEESAYPHTNEHARSRRNGKAFVCFLLFMLGIVWFLRNLRARTAPPDIDAGKIGTFK